MPRDAHAPSSTIDTIQVKALLALVGPARVRVYTEILQRRLDGIADTENAGPEGRALFLSVIHQCTGSCKSMGLTAMSLALEALEDTAGKAPEPCDISQAWAHLLESLNQGRLGIEAVIAESAAE